MSSQPSSFVIQLLNDVKNIIDGPKLIVANYETCDYVLRVLSDIISVMNECKKKCAKQKRKDLRLDLKVKKLEFYLSWTVINSSKLFKCLTLIDVEIGIYF